MTGKLGLVVLYKVTIPQHWPSLDPPRRHLLWGSTKNESDASIPHEGVPEANTRAATL